MLHVGDLEICKYDYSRVWTRGTSLNLVKLWTPEWESDDGKFILVKFLEKSTSFRAISLVVELLKLLVLRFIKRREGRKKQDEVENIQSLPKRTNRVKYGMDLYNEGEDKECYICLDTGLLIECTSCGQILVHASCGNLKAEDANTWKCEFCKAE